MPGGPDSCCVPFAPCCACPRRVLILLSCCLVAVICSYHFPLCSKDNDQYPQICFSACLKMFESCSTGSGSTAANISLAHFASVGDRCNFWGVYNPNAPKDKPYFNERQWRDANRKCTWAQEDTSFGCFANHSRVLRHDPSRQVLPDSVIPVGEIRPGDLILAPAFQQRPLSRGAGTEWAKVVFVHDHMRTRPTRHLTYQIASRGLGYIEVSPKHLIPLLSLSPTSSSAGGPSDRRKSSQDEHVARFDRVARAPVEMSSARSSDWVGPKGVWECEQCREAGEQPLLLHLNW